MQIPENIRPTERRFVEAWIAADGTRLNGSHEGLRNARRQAIERFAGIGLPVEKEEAWKYTNIRRLVDPFVDADPLGDTPEELALPATSPAGTESGSPSPLPYVPGLASYRVALVNGRFAPACSEVDDLPKGVVVCSLEDAARHHGATLERAFGTARPEGSDGFVALNTAFVREGVFVHVPRGVMMERPIEILALNADGRRRFVQPRLLYVVDAGASVRIIESWRSTGNHEAFTNAVVECVVDRDANVDHLRLVDESSASVHVHYLQVKQLGGSVFSTGSFILGGGTVRSDAYFLPDDEYCETHLNGFYLGRDAAHIDNHTLVDHARPNCESNELYKGILDDRSVGVFNGKVLVRQDAQKTNAYQSNKSIVLTETARMFSKPELEIYADDVKCSHGATTGQLDDDALFYLRSRGLKPELARLLLLQAFAGDVLATVREPAFSRYVAGRLDELLHA